jgi:hypothetical protein
LLLQCKVHVLDSLELVLGKALTGVEVPPALPLIIAARFYPASVGATFVPRSAFPCKKWCLTTSGSSFDMELHTYESVISPQS